MYRKGWGVEQDDKEAVKLYRLSAEQGDEWSQFNLAWMLDKGKGVVQDEKEAVKWYRQAAEQGEGFGQSNLAWMYIEGRGLPKSNVNAYMWLFLAKQSGLSEDAKEEYSNLKKIMSSNDIAKAEQKAQICLNSNYKNCG